MCLSVPSPLHPHPQSRAAPPCSTSSCLEPPRPAAPCPASSRPIPHPGPPHILLTSHPPCAETAGTGGRVRGCGTKPARPPAHRMLWTPNVPNPMCVSCVSYLYLGTSGYRPLTTHIGRLPRKGSRMPASLDRRSGRWLVSVSVRQRTRLPQDTWQSQRPQTNEQPGEQ